MPTMPSGERRWIFTRGRLMLLSFCFTWGTCSARTGATGVTPDTASRDRCVHADHLVTKHHCRQAVAGGRGVLASAASLLRAAICGITFSSLLMLLGCGTWPRRSPTVRMRSRGEGQTIVVQLWSCTLIGHPRLLTVGGPRRRYLWEGGLCLFGSCVASSIGAIGRGACICCNSLGGVGCHGKSSSSSAHNWARALGPAG